ncbi:MAG: hypothetical protein CMB31_05860 [Euryarchaeota archaeon]|nr:hypothetical protein [Euryarchaeota archaeon]
MKFNHALFLDRDGTLIKECNGLLHETQIEFEEGIKEFLSHAINKKFKIIMISNQTVVSKGLLTYDQMLFLNNKIIKKIDELCNKKVFDDVYICPFHPDAQVKKYKRDSNYRKPKPGMLMKAKQKFNISFHRSLMIGDRISDVISGNLVGCNTVLKLNEYSSARLIKSDLEYLPKMKKPDYKVNSLKDIIPIMDTLT